MRELLDQVIRLRDDFQSAFISTADGCGVCGADLLGLTEIYGSVLPNPAHPRFGTIFTQPKRARELQQAVPAAPQAEQTPSEATQDTPEQPEQTVLTGTTI